MYLLKSEFHVLAHGDDPHSEDECRKPGLPERGSAREQAGSLEFGNVNGDHHNRQRSDSAIDGDLVGENSLAEN